MAFLLAGMLVAGIPAVYEGAVVAAQTKTADSKKKKGATGSQKKGTSGQNKKNSAQGKRRVQRNQGGKSASSSKSLAPKSSEEAKRMQEAAQRDIQQTKEKLRLNEQEIKTGLSDLNRLSSEIASGKTQVQGLQKKVAGLDKEITGISERIKVNEAELKLMRAEYLKAVKKMRLTGKSQSALAFIFSSENFNQAMRRIRYLRQFSAWKERKSKDIDKKIAQLGQEREKLAKTKDAQTLTLEQLSKSQAKLEDNHRRQQQLVAALRQNGDALQTHLVAKQKEANRLKETISSLIAAEQAKIEAERKAREKAEAERVAREKAEAERLAREKAEAERKALAEREAAEKALAEKSSAEKAAWDKAAAERAKSEKKAAAEKAQADRKFAEAKAKADEKARKEQEKLDKQKLKESQRTARKKGDRRLKNKVEVRETAKSSDPVASVTPKKVEKAAVESSLPSNVNFASLRGSLPRPVDGGWRITNPFGRHAMPEMPEIEYDNPGIDAEVSTGATVKAVCGGKVSGVYKVAGYGTVVIVNHGEYYTVYGNLASSNVSVGTQVGGGHALGTAGSDPDDPRHGSVHFEVWKGREKQNPSSWLK